MQKYSPIGDGEPNMREDSENGSFYWCSDVHDRIRGLEEQLADANVDVVEHRRTIDELRAALLSCVAVLGMQRDFHKVASDAIAEANKALSVK